MIYIFSGVRYFYIRQSFGLNWHEVSLSNCDVYRFPPALLEEVLRPRKNRNVSGMRVKRQSNAT